MNNIESSASSTVAMAESVEGDAASPVESITDQFAQFVGRRWKCDFIRSDGPGATKKVGDLLVGFLEAGGTRRNAFRATEKLIRKQRLWSPGWWSTPEKGVS